jgi:hypothetical protein
MWNARAVPARLSLFSLILIKEIEVVLLLLLLLVLLVALAGEEKLSK